MAALTGNNDNPALSLRFWDVASALPSATRPPTLHGNPQFVAFSPDGTLAVETITDTPPYAQIELFPPTSRRGHFPATTGPSSSVPDGKTLAVFESPGVVLLSMPTGTPIGAPLTAHRGNSSISSLWPSTSTRASSSPASSTERSNSGTSRPPPPSALPSPITPTG